MVHLRPNEILHQVAQTLNGHVNNITMDIRSHTTCTEAIDIVKVSLHGHNRPLSAIPSRRSGVVLSQYAFIDQMTVRSVPRSILMGRGEEVDSAYWGDITVGPLYSRSGWNS